jgi:AraC family transcriptional regulator
VRSESRGMSALSNGTRYIRFIGGRELSTAVARTPLVRIETIRRDVPEHIKWHFKQPELALFLYRNGTRRLRGTLDGRAFDHKFTGNLALYPAGMEIDGEFVVTVKSTEYTVVFFDPAFISQRLPECAAVPRLGFENPAISQGLEELCREARYGDDIFSMMAEGWAVHTIASLRRMNGTDGRREIRGGLTGANLRKIADYVDANLGGTITLKDMSELTGLSSRHLIRAFSESMGETPHQYVITKRIEKAKMLLCCCKQSVTEVGLAVGFSHSQHFATKFKKHTGLTPSDFRVASIN